MNDATLGAHREPPECQRREADSLQPQRVWGPHPEQNHQGKQPGGDQDREHDRHEPLRLRSDPRGRRDGPEQPGGQPEQPGKRQQGGVGVHRWQRREEVLPAEHGVIAEQAPAVRARQSTQRNRSAEQQVADDGHQDCGRDRPPEYAHDARHHHTQHEPDDAHLRERDTGERRREPDQREDGEREEEAQVDPLIPGRQPSPSRHDRLQRSTAGSSDSTDTWSTGMPPASVTRELPAGSTTSA